MQFVTQIEQALNGTWTGIYVRVLACILALRCPCAHRKHRWMVSQTLDRDPGPLASHGYCSLGLQYQCGNRSLASYSMGRGRVCAWNRLSSVNSLYALSRVLLRNARASSSTERPHRNAPGFADGVGGPHSASQVRANDRYRRCL